MNKIFLFFVMIFSITSCFKERIELDLNTDNKRLVVNAWISNLDEPQYVNLSYTTNYLGKPDVEYINNAEVKMSVGPNTYTMSNDGEGNYFLPLNWTINIGAMYKLEIEHEDQIYSSAQTMRPCPLIENAKVEIYKFEDKDTVDLYETVFDFQEIPGEGDAYYAIDFKKGSVDGDSLFNGGYASDDFVDGEYFDDIRLSEDDRLYQAGDTVIIELYSLGMEAVDYLFDIQSEVFRGGPFDPPPANVRTNISNGALGYFIIAEANSVELIIQ